MIYSRNKIVRNLMLLDLDKSMLFSQIRLLQIEYPLTSQIQDSELNLIVSSMELARCLHSSHDV